MISKESMEKIKRDSMSKYPYLQVTEEGSQPKESNRKLKIAAAIFGILLFGSAVFMVTYYVAINAVSKSSSTIPAASVDSTIVTTNNSESTKKKNSSASTKETVKKVSGIPKKQPSTIIPKKTPESENLGVVNLSKAPLSLNQGSFMNLIDAVQNLMPFKEISLPSSEEDATDLELAEDAFRPMKDSKFFSEMTVIENTQDKSVSTTVTNDNGNIKKVVSESDHPQSLDSFPFANDDLFGFKNLPEDLLFDSSISQNSFPLNFLFQDQHTADQSTPVIMFSEFESDDDQSSQFPFSMGMSLFDQDSLQMDSMDREFPSIQHFQFSNKDSMNRDFPSFPINPLSFLFHLDDPEK